MKSQKAKSLQNCLFYLLNTSSHYNSTFKIAQSLKEKGYNPVYIGGKNMRKIVELNGFEFFEYSVRLFCITKGKPKDDCVEQKRISKEDLINYKNNFIEGGYFDEVITRFDPVIIFLDTSKIGFFPDLLKKNIKFIILSTKVNLNKEPYIPPFTSSYIPIERKFSTRIACEILWLKALIHKRWNILKVRLRNNGFCLYDLPIQYFKINGWNLRDQLNFDRVSNYGLKKIPEIILSPRTFDFPQRIVNDNQIYMGPSVYTQRKELTDVALEEFISRENLVFCALGSYDSKYQIVRTNFIKKVIYAFKNEKKYNLLISAGNDIRINKNHDLPKNILIRSSVPQLTVLSHSKIMINHGGMQSITESILFGVPLMVYPLNPNLDQKGNAARVRFHNLGIVGDIIRDTPSRIIQNVHEISSDEKILNSVSNFRDKYRRSKDFENGIKFIENYIRV